MDRLYFGDIVLLKFPYSDGQRYKRRPALIVNDFNDGDIIVCRITSHLYQSRQDVYLDEWKLSGLMLPSVIRVHKIATLEKELVEHKMGTVSDTIKAKIRSILSKLTE